MVVNNKRLLEYDILRIIAICAVIMIHCAAPFVVHYNSNTNNFIIGNILDSMARIGVPFFLLISGTFMLDEHKYFSVSKIKNKILKLLLILIFWSGFYAACYDFKHFFKAFIYGHYHLWYMYLIIGLYLITPILRLFVKKENEKYVLYFIILSVIFQFIPLSLDPFLSNHNSISKLANMFQLNFIRGLTSYYLLGWLISVNFNKLKNYSQYFFIISLGALLSIILFSQFMTTESFKAYDVFYNPGGPLVLLYSCSSYITIKAETEKHTTAMNSKVKTLITNLGGLTFGIYLVHASIIHLFESIIKHFEMNSCIEIITITFIGTLFFSSLICLIISKIKYLKNLISL